MSGFRLEKEMWPVQKMGLIGKWDRYEMMTPETRGHPDVKGSHNFDIAYIENKVGDVPTFSALEESQKEYIEWLLKCGQEVWLCFGGTKEKSLIFVQLVNYYDVPFYTMPIPHPTVPAFWKGKQWLMPGDQGERAIRYCGARKNDTASIDTTRRSK